VDHLYVADKGGSTAFRLNEPPEGNASDMYEKVGSVTIKSSLLLCEQALLARSFVQYVFRVTTLAASRSNH